MGVVVHDGKKIPTATDTCFDPNSVKKIAFSYDEDLIISDSDFVLPGGALEVSKEMGVSVTLDTASGQVTYDNCTTVLIDFNGLPEGKYLVTNRVSFSNTNEIDEKSCYLKVKNT